MGAGGKRRDFTAPAGHDGRAARGHPGVCDCPDGGQWRYYVAAASTQEGGDLETYTVPAATWAVFPGAGTNQSIQDLERRILTEWLPSSGYEYGSAPDIEGYLSPDPANARYEVWIPVVKKG